MPRDRFGVGDNTAIRVSEVADDLRIFTFSSDRMAKATAQTSVPVFYAPFRFEVISVVPLVTIAFQTTELVVTAGVTGSVASIGSVTLALDTAVGAQTAMTLAASPVVAAGSAVVIDFGASTGTGTFMLQFNCRRLG